MGERVLVGYDGEESERAAFPASTMLRQLAYDPSQRSVEVGRERIKNKRKRKEEEEEKEEEKGLRTGGGEGGGEDWEKQTTQ